MPRGAFDGSERESLAHHGDQTVGVGVGGIGVSRLDHDPHESLGAGLAQQHATGLAEFGFDLAHSVGAGDTPMDSFLRGCGLAVHVGPMQLEHRGIAATLKAPDIPAMGELLQRLAALHQEAAS